MPEVSQVEEIRVFIDRRSKLGRIKPLLFNCIIYNYAVNNSFILWINSPFISDGILSWFQ